MERRSGLLILFICLQTSLFGQGQSPYQLDLRKEAVLSGLGILGTGAGLYMQLSTSKVPFRNVTYSDLIDLDEFEFFDKEFDFLISVNPNKARSDKLLYVSLVLPGMLLIDHNSRADFFRWGLMYAQTLLLVQGITDVTKYAVKRPRPYTLALGRQNEDYLLSANDRASFFSGHTSASAASSFFFARTFADYYPRSPFKNYVWGAAIAIPAMTGYLRVRAGKHYPSDVLVGYAVGALVGLAIPQLHKKQKISKRMRLRLGGQSVGLLYNL